MRGYLTGLIENKKNNVPNEQRDYIGASSIGSDCWRQIWYECNGFEGEPIPNTISRTYQIGKRLESLVLDLLIKANIDIRYFEIDGFKDEELNYFKGHVDALQWSPEGVKEAIIEIKTAKDSSFKSFVRQGCKEWNERYYAQVQSYMGMSRIYRSYIIVLNKNTSEIWDELILFDKDYYDRLKIKARAIWESKNEPPRVHSSPMWYQCKTCKFNKVCHDSR